MTNVYSGSCNPSRRAKQSPSVEPNPQLVPRAPAAHAPSVDMTPRPEEHGPYRRGRKPGPLSRSAREAQRKLNHSIIEKARRTKINDALATLKHLVPPEFDAQNDEMDEDDDDDYEEGKKGKGKSGKEKEFKLEILVRTVGYMQHLIDRVNTLEQENEELSMKVPVMARDREDRRAASAYPSPELEPISSHLPPIHSWLPAILPPSQLPSPPSSTQFTPAHLSQLPNPINLPAVASASPRCPEDEVAASLLLHIRSKSSSQRSSIMEPQQAQTPSQILGMSRGG